MTFALGLFFCMIIVINIMVAKKILKLKDDSGEFLAIDILAAAIATFFYCISIRMDDYWLASIGNSIYFIMFDIVALSTYKYLQAFSNYKFPNKQSQKIEWTLIYSFALIDMLILLINPWINISITYIYKGADALTKWEYQPHVLYNLHLAYCYTLSIIGIIRLIQQMYMVPKSYRGKYKNVIYAVLVVGIAKSIFLMLQHEDIIDVSLILFSIAGLYLYWNHYRYTAVNLLNSCKQDLLNNIKTPIVLFDYKDLLIFKNNEADCFKYDNVETLTDFLEQNDLPKELLISQDNISVKISKVINGQTYIYQVNAQNIYDEEKNLATKMLMFVEESQDYDMLTGFHTNILKFKKERLLEQPYSFVMFDINRLGIFNNIEGRRKGDEAIQYLSELITEKFEENAYKARLVDATLLVSTKYSEEKIKEILQEIDNSLSKIPNTSVMLSIETVIRKVNDKTPIDEIISNMLSTMKTKKMLNRRSSHSSLLDAMMQIQQENDSKTEAHVRRTSEQGVLLGKRLGLTDEEIADLQLLCLMHDIGKVGIPLEILTKPDKLSEDEWLIMRSHCERGYRIAKSSKELENIAPCILHHHEMWNGNGYPDGLQSESIPLLARIIAVLDAYDAMTNDRPYRKHISRDRAIRELRSQAGIQFDPSIVSTYIAMILEGEEECVEDTPINNTTLFKPIITTDLDKVPVVFKELPQSYFFIDSDFNIVSIDKKFVEITGWTMKEIKDSEMQVFDLVPTQGRQEYINIFTDLKLSESECCLEHKIQRKDGKIITVLCSTTMAEQSGLIQISMIDISNSNILTEIIQKEKKINKKILDYVIDGARKDSLTGLMNREAFRNDTQIDLLDSESTIVVLLIDIDEFKRFNDTHGHLAGDNLLKDLSQILIDNIDDIGIVGRMGGDEFAASLKLSKDISVGRAKELANELYDHISIALSEIHPGVTISMGADIASDINTAFNDIYHRADMAMFDAKINHINYCMFAEKDH